MPTAYRYLHEGIDVIAARDPDLLDVLERGRTGDWAFVCLDGTLILATRSSAPSESGHDLWYSGKHKQHGGNVQVLTGPGGYPERVSAVEPGSVHDITAAREHALPGLYRAARGGLATLTDKGYQSAGIGIRVPVKGEDLDVDTRTRNRLISGLRAPAQRANALLKRTWRALLGRVTLDPWRIARHHCRRHDLPAPSTTNPVRKPQRLSTRPYIHRVA